MPRARVADELRLWSDVFNNAAFGIGVVDPANATFRFVNQAYAAIHGWTVEELQGRSLYDMYSPADRERIAGLQASADNEGSIDYEADHIRKDGTIFPARVHVTSVRQNGEVRYRIGTVQDITRQRELETRSEQSQRLEAIGQLTAGTAHDFSNLMQAIIAHLELVDDETDVSPATREHVHSAVRIAEQGGVLINQLLSFARRQLLVPRDVDLGGFLDGFRSLLARTLDPRVRIEVAAETGLLPVWVDATHLQNALLNIAINARDAMPSGGDLRIEASRKSAIVDSGLMEVDLDRFVVLRVADTGVGIAPQDLPHVFEPFFSTKGLNGTGLGLSMVHGFIKQSGGDLRISSEPGKGTCIELWLPLAGTQAAAPVLL